MLQQLRRLVKRRIKRPSSSLLSSPAAGDNIQQQSPITNNNNENNIIVKKSKEYGVIKVIIWALIIVILVFVMFSVFQPRTVSERPPLQVITKTKTKTYPAISSLKKSQSLQSNNPSEIARFFSKSMQGKQNAHLTSDFINNLKNLEFIAADDDDGGGNDQYYYGTNDDGNDRNPGMRMTDDVQFIEDNESAIGQRNEEDFSSDMDKYSSVSYPPRPPQSHHISIIDVPEHHEQIQFLNDFWNNNNEENVANDDFSYYYAKKILNNPILKLDSSNLPSLDNTGQIYIMNYIFSPYSQLISIFLLTSKYLNPKSGLHAWPSRRRRKEIPSAYKNIRETLYKNYKTIDPSFACVFRVNDEHIFVSQVDFVPNNTTRDRYVNDATDVLRCDIPIQQMSQYFATKNNGAYTAADAAEEESVPERGAAASSLPWYNKEHTFEFLLTQKWRQLLRMSSGENSDETAAHAARNSTSKKKLVHVKLSFVMGDRSGIKLLTKDDPLILHKANQKRFLSLCMPPISEPISFIAENIYHHLMLGIQHIYIGTHFPFDKKEEYNARLLERLKYWFDKGLITIWPHEQPFLGFTDKAKSHWLNQCLYYAKDRDSYALALDADEFLLFTGMDAEIEAHLRRNFTVSQALFFSEKIMEDDVNGNGNGNGNALKRTENYAIAKLKEKTAAAVNGEGADDHWCWLTFASFQMWQLTNAHSQFMIGRFEGREMKAQYTWSKAIWNTKHLWYTGYHAGGACSAQKHDWRLVINDWRESIDAQYVYRWDFNQEARLLHFYNCRQIRIEPKTKIYEVRGAKLSSITL